jgi:hypothetical protein
MLAEAQENSFARPLEKVERMPGIRLLKLSPVWSRKDRLSRRRADNGRRV